METNDKFKNSPIHDKGAILKLMDELSPAQMVKTVDFMRQLRESINSDAQGESRNVSQNEQTKKFFNCPACNRQLLLKVDSVCKCGLHLKSFTIKN